MRYHRYVLLSAFLALLGTNISGVTSLAETGEPQDAAIEIRQAALRESPSALARVTGRLDYGVGVIVLEEDDSWVRVQEKKGSQVGWVRTSAVRRGGFKLGAGSGQAPVIASAEEVAFAAKGMRDIEREFAQNNQALHAAFESVDMIEASPLYKVTPQETAEFLKAGGLQNREDL